MTEDKRIDAVMAVWFSISIALAGLFISAAAAQGLSAGHIVLALALILAAGGTTYGLLRLDAPQQTTEKAKRETIEQALRNLSDADLQRLRERLQDDNMDDALLTAYLANADQNSQSTRG